MPIDLSAFNITPEEAQRRRDYVFRLVEHQEFNRQVGVLLDQLKRKGRRSAKMVQEAEAVVRGGSATLRAAFVKKWRKR